MRLTSDSRLSYLAFEFSLQLYTAHTWLTEPATSLQTYYKKCAHPASSTANQFVRSKIKHRPEKLGIDFRVAENRPYLTVNLLDFYPNEIERQLNTDSNEPADVHRVSQFGQMPAVARSQTSARQPFGTPVHQGDQALSFAL